MLFRSARARRRQPCADDAAQVGGIRATITATAASTAAPSSTSARTLATSERPLALDLVVFLDPSSTGRALVNPRSRPITINRSVNYYTRNRFVWGPLPIPEQHENIDLGDPAAGYLRFRQFLASRERPAEFAYHPRFYSELLSVFRAVAPLIRFLNEPLLRGDREGATRATRLL